jgi:hypothetical protein
MIPPQGNKKAESPLVGVFRRFSKRERAALRFAPEFAPHTPHREEMGAAMRADLSPEKKYRGKSACFNKFLLYKERERERESERERI